MKVCFALVTNDKLYPPYMYTFISPTFALDVLALVAGGAGPGAADAEHNDQEQDGRGRPHQHPNHQLQYSAVIGCHGEIRAVIG